MVTAEENIDKGEQLEASNDKIGEGGEVTGENNIIVEEIGVSGHDSGNLEYGKDSWVMPLIAA